MYRHRTWPPQVNKHQQKKAVFVPCKHRQQAQPAASDGSLCGVLFPVFSSHPAVGQQRTHQVGGVDLLVGGFCSLVPVTWIGRRTELAAVPKTEAGRQTAPGETPPLSSSKSTFCISVHASDQRLHVAGRRAGPRGRPHASEGQTDEMPKVVACLESLESQPAPDHDETAALDMVCQLLLWHQPGARCR